MKLTTKENFLQPLPKRQAVITMTGVMLALFLASLDQTIVGTAMPRIITDRYRSERIHKVHLGNYGLHCRLDHNTTNHWQAK